MLLYMFYRTVLYNITVVVKSETNLDDKMDPLIHDQDATKFSLVD